MTARAFRGRQPVLERRYRRVLRCYPKAHRAVHEREMLDLLMTGAATGQQWPDLVEVASLAWGAFRLWFWGSPASQRSWRDVLAIFCVAGPLVMFAGGLLGGLVDYYHLATMPSMQYGMHHSADWRYEHAVGYAVWSTLAGLVSPGLAGLPLLALAAWARMRRTAITVCVLTLAWNALSVAPGLFPGLGRIEFHSGAQPVYVYLANPALIVTDGIFVAELVALLASPGLRRGRELLGRRQLRYLGLAALTYAACIAGAGPQLSASFYAAATAVMLLLLAMLRRPMGTRTGRRLMLVFLLVGLPVTLWPFLQLGYQGVIPQPAANWLAAAMPPVTVLALVLSGLGGVRRIAARLRRPLTPPSDSGRPPVRPRP